MADVIYIALTLAFFGVCIAYVFLCDRIIGPDEAVVATRSKDREPAAR